MAEFCREILDFINSKIDDYEDDSLYICDDGLTFMFHRTSDSKVHVGVISIKDGSMKLVS